MRIRLHKHFAVADSCSRAIMPRVGFDLESIGINIKRRNEPDKKDRDAVQVSSPQQIRAVLSWTALISSA